MTADILNLDGWRVLNVDEKQHSYRVAAEMTSQPRVCMRCGAITEFSQFGTRRYQFSDLTIHGKQVEIVAIRKRHQCCECKKVFILPLISVDEKRRITLRLKSYIQDKSFTRTFTSIASDIGLDEKTIRNVFRDYVSELEKEFKFETPEKLGIDEVHLLGTSRGVMSNVDERTLIEMLPNRNKRTIIKYFSRIPDRKQVKIVCMDMWRVYREIVETLMPDADIVIDKFHVVRMANDAVEHVRKQIRSGLEEKERVTLMHDRFLLLRRERELEPKDKFLLDTWTDRFPTLGKAHRAKETFFEIWDTAKNRDDAKMLYADWRERLTPEIAPAFGDLTRAITNWDKMIFNYFEFRVTNAITETLNGITKQVNRQGRGYSFEIIRAKMLYSKIHERRLAEKEEIHVDSSGKQLRLYESRVRFPNYGVDVSTIAAEIYSGKFFNLSTTKSD